MRTAAIILFVANMGLSLKFVAAFDGRGAVRSGGARRSRERTMEEVCKQTVRPAREFVTACFRRYSAETRRYQFLTRAPRAR